MNAMLKFILAVVASGYEMRRMHGDVYLEQVQGGVIIVLIECLTRGVPLLDGGLAR
jgi:hypothetical protein